MAPNGIWAGRGRLTSDSAPLAYLTIIVHVILVSWPRESRVVDCNQARFPEHLKRSLCDTSLLHDRIPNSLIGFTCGAEYDSWACSKWVWKASVGADKEKFGLSDLFGF